MNRYEKHNYVLGSLQISKNNIFKNNQIVSCENIKIQAGHFKLNSFYGEHSLMLASLTGNLPDIRLYKHGKRQKNTILLNSTLINNKKWKILDKFLNEWLPSTSDVIISNKKITKMTTSFYNIRIQNIFELDEINSLLTDRIVKHNIYLPLFIGLRLTSNNKINNKMYLKMLRLPY
jgi:hypothetical protein